jgi:hypothetical protein
MLSLAEQHGASSLFRALTIEAYGKPRMNVAENQQRMISDFRDGWHTACLQTGGSS